MFAKYDKKIGETDEFKELKKNASQYSIEDLRKECLCIVGLYASVNDEDKDTDVSLKFSVEPRTTEDKEDPYGGLMRKHLNR